MFPDYYKTLGIPPAAGAAEVKAAYRLLAAKYHPDKAGSNPFAESHFKDISEAYRTLSDPAKKQRYDEERWLRGMSTRSKDSIRISPQWLLAEAEKLAAHIRSIDTHRMNQAALHDYVHYLLSDEHLSVWEAAAANDDRTRMIQLLLPALKGLRQAFFKMILPRLEAVAGNDAGLRELLRSTLSQKAGEERLARVLPLLVMAAAMLICALIIIVTRQH